MNLGFLTILARATHHLSLSDNTLTNTHPYHGKYKVTVGNGKKSSISHVGSKSFQTPHKSFQLRSIPHLATNLISVPKFCTNNNLFLEYHPTFFLIKDWNTKKILLQGNIEHSLYKFPNNHIGTSSTFFPSRHLALIR